MLLAHAMTSISGGVCWATIDSLHSTKVEHVESTYALALSTGANVGFSLTLVHNAHVRGATERKIFVAHRESKVGQRKETRLTLDLCVHTFDCGGMHHSVNHILALAYNDIGPFAGPSVQEGI